MSKIVIVGGGWAGVGAAVGAIKGKADEVLLLERTDMLLGTGLVGGIFRNNGRFVATEEMIAMGAGEAFEIMDKVAVHRNIEFPKHKHASLYNIYKIEPKIRKLLKKLGVDVHLESRVVDVRKSGNKITSVILESGEEIWGDVFVDATGTSAKPANCTKYGNGCAYCILRCYTFKPRVSITEKAGVVEYYRVRSDNTPGSISGSVDIAMESLAKEIREELEKKGVVVIPLPKEIVDEHKLELKACVQYAHPEFAENLVLLHTETAKLMTPYLPLEILRKVPGFENARYEDPLSAGKGNSIRFIGIAPRSDTMQVEGLENVFVAGEKSGPIIGHTEAYVTGVLAGYNAVLKANSNSLITLPRSTAIGDFISFVNEEVQKQKPIPTGFTFSGGVYFERMKQLGLYTTDVEEIRNRVKEAGVSGIFS